MIPLRLGAALVSVCLGVVLCTRRKQPLFFKILLFAAASYLLGALFEGCWELIYGNAPGGFHIGCLGYVGMWFFLFSSYFGAIDRLADGGTFFVVLILVSIFSCGLLVSFVPSLSNVMAGIISLILGIVAGVICIKLQKPIIILVTAFCGALGTVQILFQLLKFEQITIFYGAFLSLAMIGSIVQFLSTRRDA